MKKIFGFILLSVGILFPLVNAKQSVKNKDQKTEVYNSLEEKESTPKVVTPEQEEKEIQNRLKGLGYFQ